MPPLSALPRAAPARAAARRAESRSVSVEQQAGAARIASDRPRAVAARDCSARLQRPPARVGAPLPRAPTCPVQLPSPFLTCCVPPPVRPLPPPLPNPVSKCLPPAPLTASLVYTHPFFAPLAAFKSRPNIVKDFSGLSQSSPDCAGCQGSWRVFAPRALPTARRRVPHAQCDASGALPRCGSIT